MNDAILGIIASAINQTVAYLKTIQPDTSLSALGFTSQGYMMCLFDLEEVLNTTFEDESSLFINIKTWQDLCNLVENTVAI